MVVVVVVVVVNAGNVVVDVVVVVVVDSKTMSEFRLRSSIVVVVVAAAVVVVGVVVVVRVLAVVVVLGLETEHFLSAFLRPIFFFSGEKNVSQCLKEVCSVSNECRSARGPTRFSLILNRGLVQSYQVS